MTEKDSSRWSDKGIVHVRPDTTPAVALPQRPVHVRWPARLEDQACGGVWRDSNRHPQSTAPHRQKNLLFTDHQKMGPPNSMVPKVAETAPRVLFRRGLFSQREGGLRHWTVKCQGLAVNHRRLTVDHLNPSVSFVQESPHPRPDISIAPCIASRRCQAPAHLYAPAPSLGAPLPTACVWAKPDNRPPRSPSPSVLWYFVVHNSPFYGLGPRIVKSAGWPWPGQSSCPNETRISSQHFIPQCVHEAPLSTMSTGSYEIALVVCHCWRSDMTRPKASLISSKASCSRNRMTLMGSRYNSIVAITGSS